MAATEPRYDHVVLGWNDGQDENVEVCSLEEAQAGDDDVGEVCSQGRLVAGNVDHGGVSRGRSSSLTAEAVSSSKDEVANGKKVADLRTESSSRKLSTGKTTSDNCKEKGKEPLEADKAASTMSGSSPEDSSSQCSKKRKLNLQRRRRKKVKRLLQKEKFSPSSSSPAGAGASSFARERSLLVEAAIENLASAVEVTANLSSSKEDILSDQVAQLDLCVTCGRTRRYDETNMECSCPEPEAPVAKITSSIPCEPETTEAEGEADAALEAEKIGANRDLANCVERSHRKAEQDQRESADTEAEPRGRVQDSADNLEIESVWASKGGETSYLVKWKGRAHIHNSKLTEAEIMKLAPKRLSSFKKAVQQGKEMKWDPLWNEPQRIIGKRTRANSVEWLVKWKGLGYDQCTWEADSRGFKDFVALYEHWCEVQNQNQNLQLVDETSQQKIVRLESAPEWFRGEPLPPHQLDLLNRLCECWWARREGIIVCDLIQEQMVQMAIFVGRLFMEFGVRRPVLIITSREMLHKWETMFEQVSANLNTVLYDGPADVREMVKKYEFNLIEGCPKVQVVLSTISTVNSDVDFLKLMHWSALLVDRPRRAKSHKLRVFSQLETMFRVLVITATQEGISDLLSFVRCPPPESSDEFGAFLDLKEKLRSYILWDAGEGSPDLLCEFWVPVQLSPLQVQQYCEVLLQNFELLCCGEPCYGEKQLKDLVIELRDCCCHPYLVNSSWADTIKASSVPDQHLDAEVAASGKLQLVRTMLSICLSKKQTVVLLTQGSHKLMDILDDFLRRQFGSDCYERIQRGMDSSLRQASLQRFNANDSGRSVLVLDRSAMAPRNLKSIDAVIVYESCWNPYKDTAYLQDLVASSCSKYVNIYRLYSHLTVEERILVSALEGAEFSRSMNAKELQELLRWGVKDLLQMRCWVDSGNPLKSWDEFISQDSSEFERCRQRLIVTSAEEVELMASFSADSPNFTGLSEKLRTVLSPRSIPAKEGPPLFDVTAADFLDKNLSAKDFWSPLLSEKLLDLGSSKKRKSSGLAGNDKDDHEKNMKRMRKEKSVGPSEEAGRGDSAPIPFEIGVVADLQGQALELFGRFKSLCEVLDIPSDVSVRAQELLVYVATHLNICNSSGDVLGELALALVWVAAEQMNHDLDRPLTIKQASSKLGFELDYIHQIYAKLTGHTLPRPANDKRESLQALQAADEAVDSEQLDAAAEDVPYCEPVPVSDAVPPDRHADKHEGQTAEADKDRENAAAEKRTPEDVAERRKMLEVQRLEWVAFYKRKKERKDNLLKQQARELSVVSGLVERAEKLQHHELQLRELEELDRSDSQALGSWQLAVRSGQLPARGTTSNGKEKHNPRETRPSSCAEKQCTTTARQPVAAARDNVEERASQAISRTPRDTLARQDSQRIAQTAALALQDLQRVATNLEKQGTVHAAVAVQATAVCGAAQEQTVTQATDVAPQQQNPQQHYPVRGQAASWGQGLATTVAAAPPPPVDVTRRLQVLDGLLQLRNIETPAAVQQTQVEDGGTRGAVPTTSARQPVEVDSEICRAQSVEDIFGVQRRVHFQDPLRIEEKNLLQELQNNKKTYEEEVARLRMIYGRRHQELNAKLAKVCTQRLLAEALRQKNTIGRLSISSSPMSEPGLDLQQNVEHPRQVSVVQQQCTTRVHSSVFDAQHRRHVAAHQPHQCTVPVSQHWTSSTAALQQQQHPIAQARPTAPQHPRNPVHGASGGANVSEGVVLAASQMLRTQSANRVQNPTVAAHTAAAGTFNLPPPSQMLQTPASAAAVAGRVQTPPQVQGLQQQQRVQALQQVLQGSQVVQQPPLQGLHQVQAVQQQQQQRRRQVVQGFQVVQPPLPQQQREQLVQGLQQGSQVVQSSLPQQLQGSQVMLSSPRQQASFNLQHPMGTSNSSPVVNLLQQQLQQQEQQVIVVGTNARGVCLMMRDDGPSRLNVNHIIELSDDDN